jgi:hypothetical protein
MSVAYKVDMPDGTSAEITPSKVVNDLSAMGVQATLTPNGQEVHYNVNGQAMAMPVRDMIAGVLGPVTGILFDPGATDFSGVDSSLRLGIENLPSDDLRQKFLTFQMETRGIKDPQIFGQGSDWALFDPNSGQYKALTNRPGMDLSDIGQVGAEGTRILGSIGGGALGAASGLAAGPLGAVAGGALGSGVGGQLGRAGIDALLAATQPGYRETLASLAEEGLGDFAAQRAGEFGIDVAGGTLGSALGLIPGLKQGALTKLGSTLSGATERTGATLAAAGGAGARSEFAKQAVPIFGGLETPQIAAWLAQGPAYVGRNLPKVGEWVGKKLGRPELAEEAAGLGAAQAARGPRQAIDRAIRDYQTTVGGEAFQRGINQPGRSAGDVLEDVGQRLGGRLENWAANRRATRAVAAENARASATRPIDDTVGWTTEPYAETVRRAAEERGRRAAVAAAPFETDLGAAAADNLGRYFGRGGRNIGDLAESLAAGGRTVERGIQGAAGLGFRGLQGLGYGLQGLGTAGKVGFGLAQPLEYRALGAGLGRLAEENYLGR